MNLLTIGKLDREASHPAHDPDPLGRFYDVGTELSLGLHPWLIFGLYATRYHVSIYLGPLVVWFYSRKSTTGFRAKADRCLDQHV